MNILSVKTVFNCPILRVEEREVEYASGTHETRWVVVHVPNVEMVGLTRDKNIVFIKARRGTQNVEYFELPGGKVYDFAATESDLRVQAIDELRTETGFTAGESVQQVFDFDMQTDWLERRFYYFAAWDLEPGTPEQEAGEDITTVLITIPEVENRLQTKQFPDHLLQPLTAALAFFRRQGLI